MSARSFRCKAILFDLDGVLVDSAECVERSWRVWAERHNLDVDRVLRYAHGRRTIETVQLVAPELSADEEVATLEVSEAMTSEGVYEIEGAREILARLPADKWAVVTSGVRAVAEFRLRLTGLPIPRVMVCADDIDNGKPHPEGYLEAAALLGTKPGECVVIEDATAGIEAARNAGMRVIAIATTHASAQLSGADLIVDRLNELRLVVEGDDILIERRAPRPPPED